MAKEKFIISRKRLGDLYWQQKLTTFEIAEIFNCSALTIINRMNKYNIRRRHSGLRRINVSKETLCSLYVRKGLSSRQIAKICHCEQSAILSRLRKFGILIRQPKAKVNVPNEDLKNLYIQQELSAYKIAKIYHCGAGTVYRYLKLYNIKTRPLKRINIPKDKLKELYIKKKYSISRIAGIYKCNRISIWNKMKKFGIPTRTISETSTRYPKKNFNGDPAEKAYMIGFRLGDLRVRKTINLVEVGCGTTKDAQIQLIQDLFKPYGPVWITKRDKKGAFHIDCSLNHSFSFLLPKHELIPKWISKSRTKFLNFLAGYTDAEGNIQISQNRARFRIRTYDKGILQDLNKRLNELGVKSLFRLESNAGVDKRGVRRNKDSWALAVSERKSLLKLFEYLQPLLRHEKRKRDLTKGLENVVLRLKNNS